MEKEVRYGVGEQSFEVMREGGFKYVDKTSFIEKIIRKGQYYFLGRPRRFGKSLFLSTLKCFFLAKKDLFKGLYAESMDWEWKTYPVLYLDLNVGEYSEPWHLENRLNSTLSLWEEEYGIEKKNDDPSIRLEYDIRRIYEKTGMKIVILVDEYDKPLVNTLDNPQLFESYRKTLAAFYSNFKSSAEYLRLVFLTGVSRFGHLSVFSGLNNIDDISFDDSFSAVCGITEQELYENFKTGITLLSDKFQISEYDIKLELKKRYDGYRFSAHGQEMYNPYSIVNVMNKEEFRNYWIYSGQATLLKEQLFRFNVDLESLLNTVCDIEELRGIDLDNPNPIALMYQTGYLTIKNYEHELYTLGLPNWEVSQGFLLYLLPAYANLNNRNARVAVLTFLKALDTGNAISFMECLKSLFSSVSYDMNMEREQNLHNALLILMKLLGLEVQTEYRTSNGRIDLFIKTEKFYYIIELKLDKSAQEALDQINRKEYALPFSTDGHKIIKIGVNFSTKTRTISEWIIEE